MTMTPNEAKGQIVAFINQYRIDNHTGPTYEDVARHLGVAKSTAWRWIQDLIWDNLVEVDPEKYRSLRTVNRERTAWHFGAPDGERITVMTENDVRARLLARYYLTSRTDMDDLTYIKHGTVTASSLIAGDIVEMVVVTKDETR